MDLYVIRHGETEWNKGEVFRGRKDIPLNETGKGQARQAGLYFTDRPLGRIVSGPLSRTLATAEPIREATGTAIEVMEEFIDMSFGVWEGLPLREVEHRYPIDLATWRATPQKLHVDGGETLAMVRARVWAGLQKAASHPDGAVAVVTHRVICKMIVLACLNIGNEHFWDMRFDPCSITLLQRTGDVYTLMFSNETCHQREAGAATVYRDF